MFNHQHPMNLIDLQIDDLTYEDEEEDDVKQEIAAKQEFRCRCNRCGEEINWYHRYYYNCNQCIYSIHKFCAQLPATLEHHPSHVVDHPLILFQREEDWQCYICETYHEPEELGYWIFYQCTTCPTFFLHRDCAFLPRKLKIQGATDGFFSHTHPLTLAYSFPTADREAKHNPTCRVCDKSFLYENENLWIYKCEDCRYYTHLDCATARDEPFMSIFSTPGLGKTIKNFDDADYPDLLYCPLPDQTDSLLKHIFFKQMPSSPNKTLHHKSHPHPLILVDHDDTKSKALISACDLLIHNPMKKIELLCNGCLRPITHMPFYKCTTTPNQEECCDDFVLHEWCTRLPNQVLDHPAHPQHPLLLLSNASQHHKVLGVFFWCGVCRLRCNGFVYSCVECDYHIDVNCAFMPDKILHDAHPNHLINWRVQSRRAAPRAPYPLPIPEFLNIKFGGIHNIEVHPHPVSFDQGIERDGHCHRCWSSLWYMMIFKCLQCKYVIHIECCKSFKNW
ncbi:hypothetical protein OSB04_020980 [Centaurea solstitialis]|uniref:DC1 domain-containing protein n=1 Tax=Centaurea solstitialis TaxID=347529 RepID=A0AA38W4G8_9ASTR|nr:hypothetical protein OSB04_020980 [Centaurea solstitialis]